MSNDKRQDRGADLEARVNALVGESAKKDAEIKRLSDRVLELEGELSRARGALRKTDAVTVAGLLEGEVQLRDGATFPAPGGGISRAKPGDLLTTGGDARVKALQTEVGTDHRVYAADRATIDELRAKGLLRG